jgi:hypothetical protein
MHRFWYPKHLCVLSVTLVFLVSGMPSDVIAQQSEPAAPQPTDAPTPEAQQLYEEATGKLDRLYAALDALDRRIDKSTFDIPALARKLGPDPAAAFAFVRDRIRYEPYWGMLRGARGTLAARSGNALDRSLLLAALLHEHGLAVEIASGRLDADQAGKLAARIYEPRPSEPEALASTTELAREVTAELGVSRDELMRTAQEAQTAADVANEKIWDVVENQSAALSAALDQAGIGAGTVTPISILTGEASEHYWVRYRMADGTPVDLDPAFPDSRAGATFAEFKTSFPADSVPPELTHRLGIRLVLGVATKADAGETISDIPLIDEEFPLAGREEQGIRIANVPWPPVDPFAPDPARQLAEVREYSPLLIVGDQVAGSSVPDETISFDLTGKIYKSRPGSEAGNAERAAQSQSSALQCVTSKLDIFSEDKTCAAPTRIVGEWVEYRLVSPQGAGKPALVRSIHRDILPTIEPADAPTSENLAGRLFWSAEVLPVTGAGTAGFIEWLQLQAMLAGRDQLTGELRRIVGLPADAGPKKPAAALPVRTLALAAAMDELTRKLIEGRFPDVRLSRNRPGLLVFELGAAPREPAQIVNRYDIAAAPIRILAENNAGSELASELATTVGVLQARLEWSLLAASSGDTLSLTPSMTIANATEDLAKGLAEGFRLVTLTPLATPQQVQALNLSREAADDITKSLTQGMAVVVLEKQAEPVGVGESWWTIYAASSEVIGVMPGARGMAEDAIQRSALLQVADRVTTLIGFQSATLACMVGSGLQYYFDSPRNRGRDATRKLISCAIVGAAGTLGALGSWRGNITFWIAVIASFVIAAN